MEIKVIATQEEKLKVVLDALCNTWLFSHALQLQVDNKQYQKISKELKAKGEDNCYEDVLIAMVKSGTVLNVIDTEGDDEPVGNLSLATIEANWDKVRAKDLMDIINEEDDADTADNILQFIALGEIVYG